MEFDFELQGLQGEDISVWDAARLVQLKAVDFHKLRNVLEEFGQRSAVAQGLRAPITDIWRLRSSDQRLYLQTSETNKPGSTLLVGGLKVGKKKLFIHRANGTIAEIEPLCVLDFYVHEQYQRKGVGKALFEHMLAAEQLCPEQLAYDRPSPKLLSFVRKHYGLSSYVPQSNNFVVFEQHFQHSSSSSNDYRRTGAGRSMRSSRDSSGGGNMPQQAFNCTWGNGRQNVHVIGSAAAIEQQHDKQWLPTSVRPPTPSLQQNVQLQPADVASSSSSSGGGGWAGSTFAGSAAALTSSLGGPGCKPAGMPTQRPERQQLTATSHTSHFNPCSQQQQQQQEVQYARGQGYKMLDRGLVATSLNTFKGYEAALLGAANKPAPPLLAQQGGAGFTGTAGLRDSLDQFSSSMGISSSSQQQQQQGSARQSQGGNPPWATSDSSAYAAGSSWQYRRVSDKVKPPAAVSYPPPPYGQWEPEPGSLLPAGAAEAEQVSLRRQEEQRAQQRAQQQLEQWKLLGAGPPGHLLAAPASSYAVPTLGMVDVIGSYAQQQQQQGSWGGGAHSEGGAAVLSLSWDGLPVALSQRQQQQQQQQQCGYARNGSSSRSDGGAFGVRSQRPGELSSGGYGYGSRSGSGGGVGRGGLESRESAKYHMAGSGAASCLRMV